MPFYEKVSEETSEITEKVYPGKRVCINIPASRLRMDNINCWSMVSRGSTPIRIRAQWRSRGISAARPLPPSPVQDVVTHAPPTVTSIFIHTLEQVCYFFSGLETSPRYP